MKTKYRQTNKCIRCGDKAGNFVWTTSRQVNAGIRAMYPDGKLCQNCLNELQSVYPPIKLTNNQIVKRGACPVCGNNAWLQGRKVVLNNPRPNFLPDTTCRSEKPNEIPRLETYCSVCGYVGDVE